ncbi:MFS transporter [Bradyrhizobium sp. U87765 SZCCT0131]|uniref:MFS transporter n=1 Tax=unclassified Bradyrhizobium TaxID=2631580 RepID=UPI001BA7DFF0|nr:MULTISPECIES: MFS transporter [unclassified Bradyrhizobium]MBR1217486.1 MFS transporter [Bradyrhizobium sp. U87765 SZCCT0131]MBR1264917.1 MFS transporter [Bradyrhizobium sp. U87765 SZCCT0134]MBR1304899.1 MFS transporter [Bradyrhizobium sp. U87765 SZCCT0110]MBR1320685.1 MFS transporter [Bradyrhizobium sp. U87765 SZCCT0109]MBR1349105.1 MFS transporter [Bradyrhizobium sp. U87765 SZCCT0048]
MIATGRARLVWPATSERAAAGVDVLAGARVVETDIPARLDRLSWSRFHTLVVVALGVTWILDGLEVTLAGALSGALKESPTLRFDNLDIGFASSAYLGGAVLGAILFGWLTDRLGRKKLFFVTLALYLAATAATALSWDVWSFSLFRFLTGAGIGGEYTAINSTIQEMVPARYRGWTDLVINGSFWIGAALGAVSAIVLLNPVVIDPELGWRLAFLTGAALGLVVFLMRFWIPESPRWLMIHGQPQRAQQIVAEIERAASAPPSPRDLPTIRLTMRSHTDLREVARTLFRTYRQRSLVGLALMTAQAFFYNAIFFTYALVLTDFFGIAADRIGWYILPFAAGNFLGPLLLGRLFDSLGRRVMIALTYGVSGLLLAVSGYLFSIGVMSAQTQTISWMVIFFFASPAASAAYLTVSETFPLEVRALAIALFYAIGTGIGGVAGPALFGALIASGSRNSVFAGYLLGAFLMVAAAVIAWRFCIPAERRSLEDIARPLAAQEQD